MSVAAMRAKRPIAGRGSLLAYALIALGLVFVAEGVWMPAKAMLAQHLLEQAFARSRTTGQPQKPWPWFDSVPVARIRVPRLGQDDIALEGASGQALAFGPGHVSGTPQAGDPGTAVYAAHRDTQFSRLDALVPGDAVTVEGGDGRVFTFQVTGHRVVAWNRSGIDPQAPGRHLVLATCWPLGAVVSGPMRLLVEAELVDAPTP